MEDKKTNNHHNYSSNGHNYQKCQTHQAKQALEQTVKQILIIDDDQSCVLGMEILLFGYPDLNVIGALGGKEGLKFLLVYPKIDLIFLDMMMPDLHGLSLLEIVKQDSILKKIPVIIQTGVATDAELERAYALGAVAVLKKPYTKERVLEEINKIFYD